MKIGSTNPCVRESNWLRALCCRISLKPQPRVISPVLDCSRFSLEQFKHSRLSAILTHTTVYARGFPSKVKCTCDSLSFKTHKYKFFQKKLAIFQNFAKVGCWLLTLVNVYVDLLVFTRIAGTS